MDVVSIRVVPFSSTKIHSLPKFCWGNQAGGAGNRNDQDPEFIKLGKGLSFWGSMSAGRLCSVLESVMSGRMDPLVC